MNSRELLKNAIANILSGSSMALISLLMPFLLLKALPTETFGIWALVMQIAAYVNVLSFNMQTVVGRYVALELAAGRVERARRFISSAVFLLSICGLLGMLLVIPVWLAFGDLFKQVPPALAEQAKVALLLMGAALSLTLPIAAFNGVFTGLQRNEVVAAITIASRAVLVLAIVWVAHVTHHLGWMGLAFAAVTALTLGGTIWRLALVKPALSARRELIGRSEVHELIDYSTSLAIWSISMLLVTGLNSAVVGIFDYPSLAAFVMAASLVTFLVGIQQSIFAVLIPAAAQRIGAADDKLHLGKLLLQTTRYGCLLLAFAGVPLLLWAEPLLSLWLDEVNAARAAPILQVLVIGNMVRLSAVPFVNLAIAAGEQKKMLVTPIIEGMVNLAVSVFLCQFIGAIGVAIGTLIGAFLGVGGNILVNMRGNVIKVNTSEYILDGLLRPYLCFLPVFMAMLFSTSLPTVTICAALFASFSAVICFGLDDDERRKIFGSILGLKVFHERN